MLGTNLETIRLAVGRRKKYATAHRWNDEMSTVNPRGDPCLLFSFKPGRCVRVRCKLWPCKLALIDRQSNMEEGSFAILNRLFM